MWVPFEDLPQNSRVWIFQSDRLLSDSERKEIDDKMTSFIGQWYTHGKPMHGTHNIIYGCFVIVVADEQMQMASGCSIDSLTELFKDFGQIYQLSFFDRFSIAYKKNNEVYLMTLDRFKEALDSGELDAESKVFNHLLSSKLELSSSWEIPIKDSWLRRYL